MNIPTVVLLSAITLGSVGGVAAATESILPDRGMTPGGAFAVTTADICVDGYTKLVRNVTVSERRHAYAEYGERNVRGMHELEHLVPTGSAAADVRRNAITQSHRVEIQGARMPRVSLGFEPFADCSSVPQDAPVRSVHDIVHM
jgi:hypothetical protein